MSLFQFYRYFALEEKSSLLPGCRRTGDGFRSGPGSIPWPDVNLRRSFFLGVLRSFSLRKKPTFLIKNLTWKKWTGIATFLYYRPQNYKTNSTIYITKNDTHYFLIAQEMLESQICLWCIFVNNLPDKVS